MLLLSLLLFRAIKDEMRQISSFEDGPSILRTDQLEEITADNLESEFKRR